MNRLVPIAALLIAAAMPTLPAIHAAEPAASRFTVTIDEPIWRQWGFQYPATYVFRLPGKPGNVEVRRRDAATGPWAAVPKRTSAEFYNGVEGVRVDREAGRAYVSVGFKSGPAVELEFPGLAGVEFDSIAKYYDGRRAAYTLSLDNWGCNPWAHPGAPWKGPTHDESDNYQAALHVCRRFHLPASIAINSRSAGGDSTWRLMQEELDRNDQSWEPAVHGQTHPKDAAAYAVRGYQAEILGCREDILRRLRNIPYGGRIYEHILTHGYCDEAILATDAGQFLFVRGFNWLDNPASVAYVPWDEKHRLYGVGGLNTKGYDRIFETREPKGRYFKADVDDLNGAFDRLVASGGIFYALWHPDRFQNSVLYDLSPGQDGVRGSTLVQHLAHVANRKDVWYVANGWLYSYRYIAQHARVKTQ